MKVNDLRDIIVYYVRVNQDKEVNMSNYDKEVLTASALLERLNTIEANATNIKHNFVGHTRALETKVKQLEDRARTQRDESDHIVDVVGHLESDVSDLDGCYSDVVPRLDAIEKRLDSIMHGADVRNHRHYKLEEDYNRQLSKCAVTQATIKAIEEKLNGID